GVLIATILVVPFYFLTGSVKMIALGTLLAMQIRLYLSENYIRRELGVIQSKTIFIELVGLFTFIILGSIESIVVGLTIYLIIYSILIIKELKEIKDISKSLLRK
uniref:hypothetical protein n=1 Tax=Clostridium sp. TaxID=1506 RepID=UPI0026212CD1